MQRSENLINILKKILQTMAVMRLTAPHKLIFMFKILKFSFKFHSNQRTVKIEYRQLKIKFYEPDKITAHPTPTSVVLLKQDAMTRKVQVHMNMMG